MIVAPNTPEKVKQPNYIERDAVAAIADWVRDGGVLVLLNNGKGYSEFEHMNQLAGRFGIRFNEDIRFGLDADPTKLQMHSFPDHPFFRGVRRLHMRSICTLAVASAGADGLLLSGRQHHGRLRPRKRHGLRAGRSLGVQRVHRRV